MVSSGFDGKVMMYQVGDIVVYKLNPGLIRSTEPPPPWYGLIYEAQEGGCKGGMCRVWWFNIANDWDWMGQSVLDKFE